MQRHIFRDRVLLLLATLLFLNGCASDSVSEDVRSTTSSLTGSDRYVRSEARATAIAARAYVYGFPLVLMELTRRASTTPPGGEAGELVNRMNHLSFIPDDTFETVVRPNRDTVYSSAFLDLKDGPMVLELPDIPKIEGVDHLPEGRQRFVMFQVLDAWSNALTVANTGRSPGTQVNHNRATRYVIAGPDFTGDVPNDMTRIDSPTNMAWVLGRVEWLGGNDLARVNDIQADVGLHRLCTEDCPEPPASVFLHGDEELGTGDPMGEIVDVEGEVAMDPSAYFGLLGRLMADQPSAEDAQDIVEDMARIGIVPGSLDDDLPDHIVRAMRTGMQLGQRAIEFASATGSIGSGWGPDASVPLGVYGDDYLARAVVAQVGFGANRREDAVYVNTAIDSEGRVLDARHTYLLRFASDPGELVNAFWSIALYDAQGAFVSNPVDRFVWGTHDAPPFDDALLQSDDGSLEVLISSVNPVDDGDPTNDDANWLPAPQPDGEHSSFELTLRLYWPTQAVLDDNWQRPTITRVTE